MFSRIIHTFGTRLLSAVINLLVAIILSQFLGPAGKGVQSLVITTITFILVFANLVGGATLVYLVPRHPAARLVVPSYAWAILTSIVAFVLLSLFPVIDRHYIIHVCILSVLNALTSINTSILIGKEKIRTANITGLIQPVLLILSLAVYFILLDNNSLDVYIYSLYISFGISLVVSFIFLRRISGPFEASPIRDYLDLTMEMIRYGILNQVAHVTQMLSFRFSYYVLDFYHGEAAVGIYSNGISLAESIWLIAKSISLVQYARISNLGNRAESARLTVVLIKASLLASLLLLVPLVFLPGSFYTFLFGAGFEETRMVIRTLAAGIFVYNFSILLGHYFSGLGRYQVNALASTIGLVVSVALYFTLIPSLGMNGAGWATSASYLVTSLFLCWRFQLENRGWMKHLLIRKEDIDLLKNEMRIKFSNRR